MTPSEQEVWEQILREPEREEPRWRYARLLKERGDPYGEFIEMQLKQAQLQRDGDHDMAESVRLSSESDRLLRQHGAEWAKAVAPLVKEYSFQRGFPEIVTLDADEFVRRAEAIYRVAPVVHVALDKAKGALGEVCASPHMDRILALELFDRRLEDADAIALAESDHVYNLRWLDVGVNSIGMAGLEALVASPKLPSLQWVNFAGNRAPDPCDRPGGVDGTFICTFERNPLGKELEKKYGPKRWFHWQPYSVFLMRPPSAVFIGP